MRPFVDHSRSFKIDGGRHPVVERVLQKRGESAFIANDCDLSAQNHRLWLLTGPNMAGKSTFLRQNALIAILAQMGSYVPARSAHIGVVDRLFSRVGAADDLARGRSTFMVEMVETAAILNQATEHSWLSWTRSAAEHRPLTACRLPGPRLSICMRPTAAGRCLPRITMN